MKRRHTATLLSIYFGAMAALCMAGMVMLLAHEFFGVQW